MMSSAGERLMNKDALKKRAAPFSLRLTKAERLRLESAAIGVPIAAYIKSLLSLKMHRSA